MFYIRLLTLTDDTTRRLARNRSFNVCNSVVLFSIMNEYLSSNTLSLYVNQAVPCNSQFVLDK